MFNVHIVLVKTYLLVSVWVLCMGQATLSRVSAAYYQVTVAEPGSCTSITHQRCATCGGWLGLTTRGQKSKEIITTPVLLSRHWLLGCWVILCKHLRILVRGYRHHQATAAHRRTLLKDYCCTSPVVGILKIAPVFWGEAFDDIHSLPALGCTAKNKCTIVRVLATTTTTVSTHSWSSFGF